MKRQRIVRSLLVLLLLISSAFSPSDALELRWARRGKDEKAGAADGRGRGKKNPGGPRSTLAWPAFTDSGEIASDVARMNCALSKKREKTRGGPAGRASAGPRRRDAGGGVARGILQWGKLLLATLGLKAGSEATFSGDGRCLACALFVPPLFTPSSSTTHISCCLTDCGPQLHFTRFRATSATAMQQN